MLRVEKLLTVGIMIIVGGLITQLGNIKSVDGETIGGNEMSAEDELKVTVGNGITMASEPGHTPGVLAVSRTGAVAAFYQHGGAYFYRVSPDGGQTWGEERPSPQGFGVAPMCVGLREGGVLMMNGEATPDPEDEEAARWILFSDDFQHYESGAATVDLPSVAMVSTGEGFYTLFNKGKIVQLANGDLLATMYGSLEGDTKHRTMIVRSTDQGRTWQYYATVAYDPNDPNPELPGQYVGACEPSIALLPNGQLLCVMRMQFKCSPPFKPLYTSWSNDEGKTWTKPIPTQPHLENVWPTLAVLDNGVVACLYGRPGIHVVFSIDNGHTWTNRVTFTNLPDNVTLPPGTKTGFVCAYGDMVKVGPNKLLAIAAVGQGVGCPEHRGTRVFPITVERVKIQRAHKRGIGCR